MSWGWWGVDLRPQGRKRRSEAATERPACGCESRAAARTSPAVAVASCCGRHVVLSIAHSRASREELLLPIKRQGGREEISPLVPNNTIIEERRLLVPKPALHLMHPAEAHCQPPRLPTAHSRGRASPAGDSIRVKAASGMQAQTSPRRGQEHQLLHPDSHTRQGPARHLGEFFAFPALDTLPGACAQVTGVGLRLTDMVTEARGCRWGGPCSVRGQLPPQPQWDPRGSPRWPRSFPAPGLY